MGIITIMLVCDDLDYAYTLAKCITAKNNRFIFIVKTMLEFKKVSDFKKYDLLLLDGESQEALKPFIQLVEKRALSSEVEGQQHYLYKYESVNYFESHLLRYYGLLTGCIAMPNRKGETRILTIHSASGGGGKTSIALGLAQELRRFHDKSVLYINFEEIETTDLYFSCSEGCQTISDYLYYISCNKSVASYVDGFTLKDEYGVEAFAPCAGINELKTLKNQELSDFLKVLLDSGRYDFMIFDCNGSFNEECLWLLSVSDHIIMVERHSERIKQNKLQKYLSFKLGQQILEKITLVINFYEGELGQIEEQEKSIFIDYDKVSFITYEPIENEMCKRINIDKDFGLGIKQLYKELTLNLQ